MDKIGILLSLENGTDVYNLLTQIDKKIKSLHGAKKFTTISGLKQAKTELQQYNKELERLQKLRNTKLDAGLSTKSVDKQISNITSKIRDMRNEFARANNDAKTFGSVFSSSAKSSAAFFKQVGGSLLTLSNTINKVTRPLSNLLRGTVFGAGYKLLNIFTEGLSGATERYDIMTTYNKQLEALGFNAKETFKVFADQDEAVTAIENLRDAVLGLPTGLDEIAAIQKIFAGVTGDLEQSTKLAIATNNAFLASGMDARRQRDMQRYILSLSSGAELTTRQWQAMQRIAPLVVNEVAKEMGVAVDEIRNGNVEIDKFLDAFIKVGTEGTIKNVTNLMKTTFAGLTANIGNAAKRLGENLFKTLDDVFEEKTGRNFIQYLLGFDANGVDLGNGLKDWIDSLSRTIDDFVKANPEIIFEFIDTLRNIDWNGLLTGVLQGLAENLKNMLDIAQYFSKYLNKDGGRFYARLLWWNKLLGLGGGLLKGLSVPLGGIAGLLIALISKLRGKSGRLGLFGWLKQFLFGDSVVNATTMKPIQSFGDTAKGIFESLSPLLKAAGAIGIAVGTTYGTFKGVKAAIRELGELIDVAKTIDWDEGIVAMGLISTFLAVAIPSLRGIGAAFGKDGLIATAIGGLVTALASGTIALDMRLLEDATKSFSGIFDHLDEAVGKLNKLTNISITTTKIKNLVNGLNSIYEHLSNLATRQATNPYGDSMLSVYDVVTLMENTIGTLHKVVGYVNEMPESTDFYSKLSKGTWIVKNLASWVDELNAALRGDKTDMANVFNGLKEFEKDFKPFVDLFKNVQDIAKTASNISAKGVADGLVHAESIILLLSNMRQRLSTTFTNRGTTIDDAFNWAKNFATDLENMLGVFTNLIGIIDNALQIKSSQVVKKKFEKAEAILTDLAVFGTNIRKAYEKMGYAVTDPTVPTFMGFEMPDVFSDKRGMFSNAKTFASDLGHMVDVFKRIGEITEEINSLPSAGEGTAFQEKLGSIIESVKGLGLAFKDGLLEGIDFEGLTETINTGIGGILKMLESKEVVFKTLGENAGKNYRNGLASEIKSISATSTINVNAKLGNINGIAAMVAEITNRLARAFSNINVNAVGKVNVNKPSYANEFSRGGIVGYYAKGGSIFKPRGTDTVPAMLTPGEYVHRRSAVRTFGKEFMDRVNNLDVEGAMKSLYSRFGSQISNSTRSVVNNYNTVNNNQKVTQNVHTNNPNFAFKRSSRFVGAF